jgi:hypothetical protein
MPCNEPRQSIITDALSKEGHYRHVSAYLAIQGHYGWTNDFSIESRLKSQSRIEI